ncbi:MAG: ATP synthase F1 subunit gamma [Candidatus Kryptoniota bacterium]
MATLREIRRRIAGVKSTEKITKAMKMVAAAKLRRAQRALIAARPYSIKMFEMVQHLSEGLDVSDNPFFKPRPLVNVGMVVVTADRGFCGAFNSNIIKHTIERINTQYADFHDGKHIRLITIGRRGSDFFARQDIEIYARHPNIFGNLKFADAKRIAAEIIKGYQEGQFDRVEVVYNQFRSVLHQEIVVEQLLPVPGRIITEAQQTKLQKEFIFEPDRETILESLLPKHLEHRIWRMLLESSTSEEGARMTAMDNASENASELIDTLSLQYNKARQAAITKELLEVVAGADALKAST